uniref:Putative ovule protein n=1 Tax=Solanum chacoense TaxID=4108 RepID=A0A0V0IEY8_SOLCH
MFLQKIQVVLKRISLTRECDLVASGEPRIASRDKRTIYLLLVYLVPLKTLRVAPFVIPLI